MGSRIILVPFAAQGHVTLMMQLARALHARGFEVTVATPDYIHRRLASHAAAAADDDDDRILFASLPSGLAPDNTAPNFAAISEAMESHMPAHLERLLSSAGPAVACVVVDLLASWAIPVARRCGVPVAGFWPAMLAVYRIVLAIPELMRCGFISEHGIPLCHENNEEQVAEKLILEGQPKLTAEELPWVVGNPASQKLRFMFWQRVLDRAKTLQWLLVNSFPEEGGDANETPPLPGGAPRTLPIGPLIAHEQHSSHFDKHQACNAGRKASLWEEDRSCLEWLEQQQPNSVVYVSFGSWVAPIPPEEITEFALGLEAARVPFLWALKDEKPWRAGLPDGYADRVAGQGGKLVAWAPQEEVLESEAVGCYLTHCGWNSTLEAIRHEKRLLCYPIAGDQFVNAAYIVRVWGAGVRLEGCDRGAVERGVGRIIRGEEGVRVGEGVARLKRRIMGKKGSSEAMANLQRFVDDINDRRT
ncbi:UDP-glycosyltransferase 82A1 [Canna indica]|uniref:Glycosyltransferase n=1 Tax=Canna indica TaxID=4628 RepID=A0AAQ3QG67_9LILI|nr:UDP-glycosyltransferase 82A1 [Canna indica]